MRWNLFLSHYEINASFYELFHVVEFDISVGAVFIEFIFGCEAIEKWIEDCFNQLKDHLNCVKFMLWAWFFGLLFMSFFELVFKLTESNFNFDALFLIPKFWRDKFFEILEDLFDHD